jgi:phage terminase large subunit
LIECLKRYRRTLPNSTGEPGAPLHDEFSHGADAYRYAALAAPSMENFNGTMQGMKLPPLKYGWNFK